MTAKAPSEILVSFSYDNARGVYEGRVNGGQRFYFSGHRDAPMPKALVNALAALRSYTMLEAKAAFAARTAEGLLSVDEILAKIKAYEAAGGKVTKAGRTPKPALTALSIEDLDL